MNHLIMKLLIAKMMKKNLNNLNNYKKNKFQNLLSRKDFNQYIKN